MKTNQEIQSLLNLSKGSKVSGQIAYPIGYIKKQLGIYFNSINIENNIDLKGIMYRGEEIITLDYITNIINNL